MNITTRDRDIATRKVSVDIAGRPYPIHIGPGLLPRANTYISPLLRNRRCAIVTDDVVAGHHLDMLVAALESDGVECRPVVLPNGERTKSFAELEKLCSRLLSAGLDRSDVLVALGGGVIGDLAGFAAAIALRGIAFVQIPTTLLAQVDSSVGGKTGINTPEGKNLVGAFHQPALVLADTDVLATLPERHMRGGYAETVKYGLIRDHGMFEWLERDGPALLAGDPALLARAVEASCRHKAEIVAEDETEKGVRALLNLGHTFGHAFEAQTGYSDRLIHGEAVALGMAMAFRLSVRLGLCSGQDAVRMEKHLRAVGLPTRVPDIGGDVGTADRLIAHMAKDKKAVGNRLTFILARGIGDAFVTRDVDADDLHQFMTDELTER